MGIFDVVGKAINTTLINRVSGQKIVASTKDNLQVTIDSTRFLVEEFECDEKTHSMHLVVQYLGRRIVYNARWDWLTYTFSGACEEGPNESYKLLLTAPRIYEPYSGAGKKVTERQGLRAAVYEKWVVTSVSR